MNHPAYGPDLEQEALEALEDFRQGVADHEQIKLLAYLTTVDERIVERLSHGKGKHE